MKLAGEPEAVRIQRSRMTCVVGGARDRDLREAALRRLGDGDAASGAPFSVTVPVIEPQPRSASVIGGGSSVPSGSWVAVERPLSGCSAAMYCDFFETPRS